MITVESGVHIYIPTNVTINQSNNPIMDKNSKTSPNQKNIRYYERKQNKYDFTKRERKNRRKEKQDTETDTRDSLGAREAPLGTHDLWRAV